MLGLRSYQVKAIDAIAQAEKEGVRRPLVVHPTGTGKTVTFSHLINQRADQGRALVLVHREELAQQAQNKIGIIAPELSTGIVKADLDDIWADVVIASVQTAQNDVRLSRLVAAGKASPFGTIVVDEAHHAPAPSWTKVLTKMGALSPYGPLTAGFTATPERDKGKTLGFWERVVAYMSIREAIYGNGGKGKDGHEGGFLVPILPAVVVETDMDMGRVRKTGGDYSDGDLGREMEESGAIAQIADAYVQHAADRKAVAFTPTVKTAHELAEALRMRGVPAAALDGGTPKDERAAILAQLRTGAIRVVVNCGVLTEGFDEPSISCIIVARPTTFHGLYVQMIGRGTRLHPGKKNLLILDIVGASQRHELVGRVDLGLDLDDPRDRKAPGEKKGCPVCGPECTTDEHRCALCRRYLTEAMIGKAVARHANCKARGGVVDVFGTSRLRWLPLPGDAWCLGAGKEIVVMVPNGLDTWRLAAYEAGKLDVLHEELPADWAMGIGEDRAKAFQSLTERNARWLDSPVSDQQKGRLVREGFPESKLSQIRTRGQAADLITRIGGRRALRRMGVPV